MNIQSTNPTVLNAVLTRERTALNAKAAITINPSPTADTRTADHECTVEELKASTERHIEDVKKGMAYVAKLIRKAGDDHDWTKLRYLPSFYEQFHQAQQTGVWGNGWYDRIHTRQERHHLNDRVPSNVNLIDVLEHIVDCVMAGKARAGEFKADLLGAGVLERAYMNTQKLIADAVEVVPPDDGAAKAETKTEKENAK